MTLVKTSVLTAVSTIIKVFTAFVINKVISIYIGPSGLALIGQLQDFNSIIMNFATGAINNGVVKYTAEYKDNMSEKGKIFSTALIITVVSSIIVALGLYLFDKNLSILILKTDRYANIFSIFGFTIILFALNTLFMSILNGQKEIKKFILINIISSLLSLVLTSFLIIQYSLEGALMALVLNQSIVFFVTVFFITKSNWFAIKYFLQGIDKISLIKLGKYSLMALTSIIMVPASYLIIRNYIGEHLGWNNAGYWQGIWYISSMYLMVITTSLGVYYLPKLSEIKDKKKLKFEIISGYKIIMPLVIVIAFSIYLFREYVIYFAFTNKFLPMLELFKWQLIGDVIKIASWLLSYLMIAKAMTKIFIVSEIAFSSSFVLLSILLIQQFGLIGVTYAFTINYSMYFLFTIIYFRKVIYEQ